MDFLHSVAKSIFTGLLPKVTIEVVDGITVLDPEVKKHLQDKLERFCGNPFPEQLHALQKYISGSAEKTQEFVKSTVLSTDLRHQYNEVLRKLNKLHNAYTSFIKTNSEFTWKSFKMESDNFNCVLEMDWIVQWITRETLSRERILDNLELICGNNLKLYELWQHDISLRFAEAYFLRTAYLHELAFSKQAYIRTSSKDFEKVIMSETDKMNQAIQLVTSAMNQKYRQLKAGFLLRNCGEAKHGEQCGTGSDKQCCELGSKVYRMLRHNQVERTDTVASSIANNLRNSYPQFKWSVVLVDNYKNVEIIVNFAYIKDVWIQRYGVRREGILYRRFMDSLIMSDGLGSYGCFLCYSEKSNVLQTDRAALVFFADPEAIKEPSVVNGLKQFENWLSSDTAFCKKLQGKGNVYRLIGQLREMDLDHVIGIGGCLNEELGTTATDLHNDDIGTFPIRVGDSDVVFWPAPADSVKSLACSLDEGFQKALVQGRVSTVFQGRLTDAPDGSYVAVKDYRLPTNTEPELGRMVRKLDVYLSVIKELLHPHVIRHLGLQVHKLSDLVLPSYRIVMDFCSGGSLASFVKKTPGGPQTVPWARDILDGLAYLHRNNLSHRFLCCDHIMFQGPNEGAGPIKIISVTRMEDVVQQGLRSYNKEVNDPSNRFMPPEAETRIGSKTDMWAFGFVFVQMLTGQQPDYRKLTLLRDTFLKAVPEPLRTHIDQCWEDYNQRPTAFLLLASGDFS